MACLPSTCPFCACGCGVLLQEENGRLVASFPSSAPPARSSLCIRGWHCTGPVSASDRLASPLIRSTSGLVPASWQEAVAEVAGRLAAARVPPGFAVGPSLATEDARAVRELAERVGGRLFTSDLTGAVAARRAMDAAAPGTRTLSDPDAVAAADLLWVVGVEPAECPQVAGLVTAARRRGAASVRFDVHLSAADGSRAVAIPPGRFGELGPAIERAALRGRSSSSENAGALDWLGDDAAGALVSQLRSARCPVVIVGARWLTSEGAEASTVSLLSALAQVGVAGRVVFAVGESNSWGVLEVVGADALAAEVACRSADLDTLVVVADDLVGRSPRPAALADALSRLGSLIVIDRFTTATTGLADVVLPSCTFAEADGSITSLFGVTGHWRRIVPPPGAAQPERTWMARIGDTQGRGTRLRQALPPLAASARQAASTSSTPSTSTSGTSGTAGTPGTTSFPFHLLLSSHPAAFGTGVLSSRDEVLRREAIEPVLWASPAAVKAAGLKSGWPARLVVPDGEAVVTVRSDGRIPDDVLVLIPLPNSTASAARGRYPSGDGRTVGLQPVPARLERG